MARKAGQLIARGQSTWLVRVYLGRDPPREWIPDWFHFETPQRRVVLPSAQR
jgi:hypothetical protein